MVGWPIVKDDAEVCELMRGKELYHGGIFIRRRNNVGSSRCRAKD
jgi:hypothetical protein